jgi:hypothetical protein
MENGFSKTCTPVGWLLKSMNLILKFSAKESVISTAQTLGKGTLTDQSFQRKSQEEK